MAIEVLAWWFWKSSGVCEIVARTDGFQKMVLLNVSCKLVVMGQIQIAFRVAYHGHGKFIPTCGLLGGGL